MATRRPDGGWGWVIAIAAFLFNFIADGVKYSFGIMFLELIDAFGKSKSATSWIISIQVAMLLAISPLAGALVNRFGCRAVAALGTLIGFVGFLVSPFAGSVYYMYATFGVVGGIGFGIGGLPLLVAVAQYFDKHLALASGISATGSGMGMLVFGPLSKLLIDKYTWRGTLLIESAFLLNGLLCAAVLRPVPKPKVERLREHTEDDLVVQEANVIHKSTDAQGFCYTEGNDPVGTNDVANAKSRERTNTETSEDDTAVTETDKFRTGCGGVKSRDPINTYSAPNEGVITDASEHATEATESNRLYIERTCTDVEPFDLVELGKESKGDVKVSDSGSQNRRWFSLSPLTELRYLLLLGSATLVELSLMTPFTFLPDMMSQAGYEKNDAVFMLFLIGVFSTLARITSGFVADLPFINRVKLCYSVIILNGVLVALAPLCFNYASYVAFAVMFGFVSGSSAALRAVLLPDFFGVEMIADRIGIQNFFNSCAALVGLPITGAIYDVSGSYVIPFLVAGIEMVASGIFVVIITLLRKP